MAMTDTDVTATANDRRRRGGVVAAAAVVLTLLAGVVALVLDGGGGPPAPAEETVAVVDAMGDQDWDRVRRHFDEVMLDELSRVKLQQFWDGLVLQVGAYQGHGDAIRRPPRESFRVFEVPMQFDRREMIGRVVFRDSGEIAGLFVVEPGTP